MADNNHTDRVLACLTEADEALTVRNITATTGLKTNDVKQALDALASEGKVESAKVGRSEQWSLTTPEDTTAETADEDSDADAEAEEAPESGAEVADATEASGSDSEVHTSEAEEAEEEVLLPAPKQVDPEVVFAATMLDQLGEGVEFSIESFTQLCGKTTPTERTRLLRSLWALAEHGLLDKSDPNDINGGTWTVASPGLAATAVEQRVQASDAPEEIEVRTVKRMPWANGGSKAAGGRAGRPANARRRGELREQIDAVLAAKATGEVVTPGAVAEEVRAADSLHREADPNAVNNYLAELRLQGRLTDASEEAGGRAYRTP